MIPEKNHPKTILVRCPNWVGDLIMATPVFECLRINYPKAKIIALTRPYNIRILEDHPYIDEIIPCKDKTMGDLWKTATTIRSHNVDMALLLPNSFRSFVTVRLAGISTIFGYRRGERTFFLKGPKPPKENKKYIPQPMVDYYLGLCTWMGLTLPETKKPVLSTSQQLQAEGQTLLTKYNIKEDDLVIGLNPGAQFGASKCWPPKYFAELATKLSKEIECKLLLFIGPGEEQIAQEIMDNTEAIIDTTADNIDLGLLKPMIKRCQLLITNDTGPRQYATAFDIPLVVLMGPTDPRYTNENLDKSTVLRHDLPCVPCHKKICPTDHQCMRDIKPTDVIVAVKERLQAEKTL